MTPENLLAEEKSFAADLDLLDYWLLIKKHRRRILMLTFIVTLLTTLVVFQMTPVYRSTALLLLENASKSKVLTLNDLYDEMQHRAGSSEAFNSQIEIIQSRPVAESVIRKLKLIDEPAMDPRRNRSWINLNSGWFALEQTSSPEVTESRLEARLVNTFKDKLTVETTVKSNIVKVSFDSTDTQLAAKIANAVVEAYIDTDLESRSQMTQKANVWLTQRMEGLRKNLEESEQALQHYREKEGIVDNKDVILSGTGKQFEAASTNLTAARMRLAEAQSAYNQVKDHSKQPTETLESIPAVWKDLTVQQMKQHETEATRILTEYKSRYAPAHPKMIAAEAEKKSAHEALLKAVETVINGITREYEIARANVSAAAEAQAQMKSDIQTITRKESQLSALQNEVDSNRKIYETYLTRAKETEVSSNLQSTAGRLVEAALPSATPLRPKKLQIIAIAAILGLIAGVGLVIFLDYLDSTMHSVPDVERRLRVDVLGTVQLLESNSDKKHKPGREFLENPNSPFSESVRTIRTAALLSSIDAPHRVIVVTSTVPGEGKTTISINLSFALGQLKRVLVIDGDIRRPSLGTTMGDGFDQGPGLVDFLAGEAPINECIRATPNPNVFVLPAGKRFNSPLELISSQKFAETIAEFKEQFDVLVIDCPPIKPVSDSLILARYANAVVYVVKADSTPYQLVTAAIKRLKAIDTPILGIVLNLVDSRNADRYGYYDYTYQYQYQYTYGQEPVKKPRSFMGIKI